MQNLVLSLIISTILFSCASTPTGKEITIEKNKKFEFYYSRSGLGSNMGSFQPVFKMINNEYTLLKKQNSYWSEEQRDTSSQFISKGSITDSDLQKIIKILYSIEDSIIYETNPHIASGVIDYINISLGDKMVKFTLHNESHPVAKKIIDIVNSYLPAKNNLRLFQVNNKNL